jgi:NAD dependent epimerase/dehydratase family enzyme
MAGLGGAVGRGSQAFPVIHLSDLTEAMVEAIEKESYSGIYNLVAPDRKDNRSFTKELATMLRRPAWLQVPGVVVKLLFGKASVLVLESPEIIPERLVREGYIFQYPDLESTLSEIIGKKEGRRSRQPS